MILLKYLCFTTCTITFALQADQKTQETAMNHDTKITGHPFSRALADKRGVQVCPGLWAFVPPAYDVIV